MKRVTILDVSSLLFAAKHSIGKNVKLSYREKPTFVIFGFLLRLHAIINKSKPDIVAFAYDSDTSIRQSRYYANYKSKRKESKKTDEQKELDALARPQFKIVQNEIIPALGYKNIFHAEGFEADDGIASVIKNNPEYEYCIVTGDEDMYQLLSPTVQILKPRGYVWYSQEDLFTEFGIEPKMWKRVKVYGGCSSDEIPGLPIPNNYPSKKTRHIGEGLALKYIKGKMNVNSNTYRAFLGDEAKRIINRNKILTILPLKGTPIFRIQHDNALSRAGLINVCNKFGFQSIKEDLIDFCRVLKLR